MSHAALDDELAIASEFAHPGGRSGIVRQAVRRAGDGELLADAGIAFVIVDVKSQKAVQTDGMIREAMTPADR
ncbi:hypothetical protein KKG45_00575 [bacterium]|nr:hypothetical protein [bacterium]MBU1071719.1 hypothetical protein [bacterium]MBU1674846.1 hypothetical protein [bacterium]